MSKKRRVFRGVLIIVLSHMSAIAGYYLLYIGSYNRVGLYLFFLLFGLMPIWNTQAVIKLLKTEK